MPVTNFVNTKELIFTFFVHNLLKKESYYLVKEINI